MGRDGDLCSWRKEDFSGKIFKEEKRKEMIEVRQSRCYHTLQNIV
jgi:hypothetical protein